MFFPVELFGKFVSVKLHRLKIRRFADHSCVSAQSERLLNRLNERGLAGRLKRFAHSVERFFAEFGRKGADRRYDAVGRFAEFGHGERECNGVPYNTDEFAVPFGLRKRERAFEADVELLLNVS